VQWISFGQPRQGQGSRTDILAVQQMIVEGRSNREIADFDFALYARLYKAIDRYRSMVRPKRENPPFVILLQGPPECGKTRWAYDNYPDLWEPAIAMGRDNWFDGYDNNEVVLLDEFEGMECVSMCNIF